jgi:hypothetical protein
MLVQSDAENDSPTGKDCKARHRAARQATYSSSRMIKARKRLRLPSVLYPARWHGRCFCFPSATSKSGLLPGPTIHTSWQLPPAHPRRPVVPPATGLSSWHLAPLAQGTGRHDAESGLLAVAPGRAAIPSLPVASPSPGALLRGGRLSAAFARKCWPRVSWPSSSNGCGSEPEASRAPTRSRRCGRPFRLG